VNIEWKSYKCHLTYLIVATLSALLLPEGHAQTTVAGFTPGTFKVNEAGAATYTIPIQVPPGIAGLEPKLAFTYNSKGRNGLLGMGWGLSGLSAITRCPRTIVQDGARGGVNFQDGTSGTINSITSDRFCLDGKRLVMISSPPTSYGANGAEYRTERETFTKIISYNDGTSGNGPTWFKVWTKAGQILEYGNTGDSRIEAVRANPSVPVTWLAGTVRIWALNKISDKKGNYLTVTYAEDNANGDFRPTRIDYDYSGTPATSNASVQFIPDPLGRTDVVPNFIAGSIVKTLTRLGYVRTYVGANLVKEYRLAYDNNGPVGSSRIVSIAECDSSGTCYAPTSFSWERSGDGTIENSGQWITTATWGGLTSNYSFNWTGDFNGDGKTDIAAASGTSLYLYLGNDNGSFTVANTTTVPGWSGVTASGYSYIWTGDFNGDGKTDIATANGSNLYLYLGNGNGFTVASTTTVPNWGGVTAGGYGYTWTGDFNGDGKTDIATANGSNLYLYLGNGNGFTVASTTTVPGWGGAGYVFIGDFNGDGKTDIATAIGSTLYLYLGNGNGFTVANPTPVPGWGGVVNGYSFNWTGDFNGDGKTDIAAAGGNNLTLYLGGEKGFTVANNTPVPTWGGVTTSGYAYIWTGDFNGDGKTDIATANGSNLYLYLGNGNGFTVANTTTVPGWGGVTSNGYPFTWTGDFNGDGKTDIATAIGSTLYLYLGSGNSSGNGFTVANTTTVPTWGGGGYNFIGDFNGDGKTDIAAASGPTAYVYQGGPVRVFPDHLTNITNGLGASTEIFYKPLTNNSIYTKFTSPTQVYTPLGLDSLQYSGSGSSSYPIVDLQVPWYVVSNTADGVAQGHTTNYTYYGLKAHAQGGGLLGFAYMQAADVQSGITTSTAFRQDYPFQGLPNGLAKVTYVGGMPVTLDKVLNTWTTNPAVNPLPYTFTPGNYHRCDLTNSVETGSDLNSVVLPSVTTATAYDPYGNPSNIAVSTSDAPGLTPTYSKTTANIYFDPDTVNWILGRVKQSTLTSVTP
jgi:Salmonella virulence plasmid 65kDa B protein/FG-GAP-like repeat/Insecticide toxin TcdB middle/N-terminal region